MALEKSERRESAGVLIEPDGKLVVISAEEKMNTEKKVAKLENEIDTLRAEKAELTKKAAELAAGQGINQTADAGQNRFAAAGQKVVIEEGLRAEIVRLKKELRDAEASAAAELDEDGLALMVEIEEAGPQQELEEMRAQMEEMRAQMEKTARPSQEELEKYAAEQVAKAVAAAAVEQAAAEHDRAEEAAEHERQLHEEIQKLQNSGASQEDMEKYAAEAVRTAVDEQKRRDEEEKAGAMAKVDELRQVRGDFFGRLLVLPGTRTRWTNWCQVRGD